MAHGTGSLTGTQPVKRSFREASAGFELDMLEPLRCADVLLFLLDPGKEMERRPAICDIDTFLAIVACVTRSGHESPKFMAQMKTVLHKGTFSHSRDTA